jgi:outer membrane protein OmpA-like peptidoglycan-associated protein
MNKNIAKLASLSTAALLIGLAGAAAAESPSVHGTVNKTGASMTTVADGMVTLDAAMLFAVDSADLSQDGQGIINERINAFRSSGAQAKVYDLEVTGYTDSTGSEEHNQKLSEARAQSVADFIAAQTDISLDEIKVIGKGESEAVATTPEGMAKERRVELRFVGDLK